MIEEFVMWLCRFWVNIYIYNIYIYIDNYVYVSYMHILYIIYMHILANKLDEAEFDRAKKDPLDLSWSLALFVTMR
jgi:hypothetical protein